MDEEELKYIATNLSLTKEHVLKIDRLAKRRSLSRSAYARVLIEEEYKRVFGKEKKEGE